MNEEADENDVGNEKWDKDNEGEYDEENTEEGKRKFLTA
jgi:hypothetical protein